MIQRKGDPARALTGQKRNAGKMRVFLNPAFEKVRVGIEPAPTPFN